MMVDDENSDEVKVFRQAEDVDDDTIGETSEQQLADDKKEAVLEAELEVERVPIIGSKNGGSGLIGNGSGGGGGAFNKPLASPSFASLMGAGLMPGGPFSPGYTFPMFMPLIVPPAYGLRAGLSPNFVLPMQAALSPSFNMFPSSPFYGAAMAAAAAKHQMDNCNNVNGGGGNGSVPLAANVRGTPLNPLNQMRMPSYMMPGTAGGSSGNLNGRDEKRHGGGGKMKKEDHIKKPLNAFMWFMKENRKKVLEESGNVEKQSAELNKELGKRWHDLPKEEQQKYFDLAKKDREDHKQKYPQWSARENYAVNKKNKKKRRDKSVISENSDQKKCRARFGVNNQEMWCKFCKRKKKCEYSIDRGSEPMTIDIQDRGSLGPSPHTSSIGRSPMGATASDSESDVEDEDVDPTISQQAREVIMQESLCTL